MLRSEGDDWKSTANRQLAGRLPYGFRFQRVHYTLHRRKFPSLRRYKLLNIYSCVFIPVVECIAVITEPKTMMQFQVLIDRPANTTGFGRRKEAVYPFGHATRPHAFVVQETSEHTPTTVSNRLGQVMVFEHPAHVQIFDFDVTALVNDVPAEFMQKIFTLISNLFILPG